MSDAITIKQAQLDREMAALGFSPARGCRGYRAEDLLIELTADWVVFRSTHAGGNREPFAAQLGQPGLWRWTVPVGCKRACFLFELPRRLVTAAHYQQDDRSIMEEIVAWARATRPGNTALLGWTSPPLALVNTWLPDSGLTARSGALARQGTIDHSPQRLALEFPVVERPAELSLARRQWLRELLLDAQKRWHLVRFGIAGQRICAQVDLTGAPQSVLEPLLPVALECLRWVVSRVLEPAQLLVDGSIDCRALCLQPHRG